MLGTAGVTNATPGSAAMSAVICSSTAGSASSSTVGHEEEGPVEARSEPVDEEVVGLAGGGVLLEVALVGEAEAQAEDGQGEHHQDDGADDGRRPRVVLDQPAPPVGVGLAIGLGRPLRHLAASAAATKNPSSERRAAPAGSRAVSASMCETDADQPEGDEARGDQPAPAADLDPVAGEPEQRGQEGERRDHRREHHHRRADGQARDERRRPSRSSRGTR